MTKNIVRLFGKDNPFYGKKHSEETKRRLSEKHKGKKLTEEHKRNIGIAGKKNYIDNPELRQTISRTTKEHWANPEIRKNFINGRIGMIRKPHTKEAKEKMSKTKKARIKSGMIKIVNGMKGRHHTQEALDKISKASKILRQKRVFPFKNTSIEIKIQGFVRELGLNYLTNCWISKIKSRYICDIFIPKQEGIKKTTIIECDGDYWHGNLDIYDIRKLPKYIKAQRALDYIRTAELEEAGWRIIRLWESKINIMTLEDFKEILSKEVEVFK